MSDKITTAVGVCELCSLEFTEKELKKLDALPKDQVTISKFEHIIMGAVNASNKLCVRIDCSRNLDGSRNYHFICKNHLQQMIDAINVDESI